MSTKWSMKCTCHTYVTLYWDGQPVLTVADDRFPTKRAMIQFVLIDGHVRFEIRSAVAQVSGLAVSSKLEALSATTKGDGR